jgi:hypothetical protein
MATLYDGKMAAYMMPCIKPSLIMMKNINSTMPLIQENSTTVLEIGSGTGI